jgi:putative PEP-CTERM system histidine kinase
MKLIIFSINFGILLSTAIDLRIRVQERRLSLALVRVFFMLPSLIATYLIAYFYTEDYVHPFFYHTENIFALLWLSLAAGFHRVTWTGEKGSMAPGILFASGSAIAALLFGYDIVRSHPASLADDVLVFSFGSLVYCSAFFLLAAALMAGWRLEAFWRSLESADRWRYKYLIIGHYLVCVMLGWSCAYRLAYLRMPRDHFLFLAVILAVAWGTMGYALARHRLLNRKLFVSRRVVYASITPIAFSVFFIFVGVLSLMSRLFNWTVPFALQWLVVVLGVLAIIVLALSASVRRRIKYYISTHFYVNKYEYRDEWLAFSDLLQGKLTEKGVVEALYQILHDCLYTRKILIWLGDIQKGFHWVDMGNSLCENGNVFVAGDDAIVCYLHNAPYLYSQEGDEDPLRRSILDERGIFLQTHGIVLMVPLILGSQCVGLIGLGPENTGGRYGHDDFDLLAALSSHAASALLAIQNAEKLARAREQSVWSNLSAFVLHDIKNAATMLDLVRRNAGEHINNPEFQKDMLESIDDALRRMRKMQTRLSALQGETVAQMKKVEVGQMLAASIGRLARNLPDLEVALECPSGLSMETDPDVIFQVLENLLINALEAGGKGTAVRIRVTADAMLQMDLQDNGPGILPDLLPRALFEPFKTGKANGSGIGLWQVRQLVECLGGDIQARNGSGGGALFRILLPYDVDSRLRGQEN